jgi:hypothetical protein
MWRTRREEPAGSTVTGYAREPRAHPAERSIALAARKLVPTKGLVASAPRRSFLDPRQIRARSALIRHGQRSGRRLLRSAAASRVSTHEDGQTPARIAFDSTGRRPVRDRIRTMWDTGGFAAH